MFSRAYTIHFWLFKPFMQRKRATCDRACRQRGRGETSGGPRCPGVGQLPPSPRGGVEDVCLVCTRTDETLVPGREGERSVRAPTITLSEKANPPWSRTASSADSTSSKGRAVRGETGGWPRTARGRESHRSRWKGPASGFQSGSGLCLRWRSPELCAPGAPIYSPHPEVVLSSHGWALWRGRVEDVWGLSALSLQPAVLQDEVP